MLSSAANKPTSLHLLEQEGFSSTQSTLQALFSSGSSNQETKQILKIDVSELYATLQHDDRFALLRQYIPAVFLFDTCHDYDRFYELLSDMRDHADAAEDVGLVLDDKTYDEIEYQGNSFVELYRNYFILPAVASVGAQSTYLVGGMTTNQHLLISY